MSMPTSLGNDDDDLRPRVRPPVVYYNANGPERGRIGDDGCIEWEPTGAHVPMWLFGLVIVGVGAVALLVVLLMALLSQPANPQPAPGTAGGPPVPTTYGAPPASN